MTKRHYITIKNKCTKNVYHFGVFILGQHIIAHWNFDIYYNNIWFTFGYKYDILLNR